MRRISTALVFALLSTLLLPSFGLCEDGTPVQGSRLALVIGNSSYKSSPLRNPVNDANDMALTLKELGFEVILKQNAGQREMERAIRDFGQCLRRGGMGLFYYAGHGMQLKGRNYLIPIGAEIYKETDVKYEAVDAGRVLDEMYEAGNDLNIVILDACRDNPFARSFRSSSKGLARMDAPTGTLIAYATAPGKVAADGDDRNGVYTKYLKKYMAAQGLTIEQVLKNVRVQVISETDNQQVPWESSSLTGDFYFSPTRSIAVVKRPAMASSGAKTSPLVSEHPGSIGKNDVLTKPQLSPKEYLEKAKKARGKRQRIEYLLAAIDADSSFFDAYVQLGETYAKGKQFQEAIEVYQRALTVQESQMVHYEIGRLSWILGKGDLARSHLRAAAVKQNYLGKQAMRLLERIERTKSTP